MRGEPTALLLLRQPQCGTELWSVAEALRMRGWRCVAVLGREVRHVPGAASILRQRYLGIGCDVVDYEGRSVSVNDTAVRPRGCTTRPAVFSIIARGPGIRLAASFFSCWRAACARQRRARRLLAKMQPWIIILQEFGLVCEESQIVGEAQRRNLPTLMLPGADNGQVPTSSLQGFVASPRAARVDVRRPGNRVAAWLFPRWVRAYRGIRMLRYPAAESMAYWCAGLMSDDPWLPHRWVRRRAVLCERARADILCQQQVESSRLVTTGQPAMDDMYRLWQASPRTRQDVLDRLGLRPDRPVALFAVPPLVLHSILSPEAQKAFVEEVLRSLAAVSGVQVIMSLYIGDDPEVSEALGRRWGAVVARDTDVRQLIAASDVVVNVRSSITWAAIACQKPTLAIDFWDFGPVSFYECPGVQVVPTAEGLTRGLRELLTDPARYDAAVQALKTAAAMWATGFDGRATERVVALVHEMTGFPLASAADHAEALTLAAAGIREVHDVG